MFEDNRKAWSGDHIVDPRIVPGVFFCNERIDTRAIPRLVDIAADACSGSSASSRRAHMDGRTLFGGATVGDGAPGRSGASWAAA